MKKFVEMETVCVEKVFVLHNCINHKHKNHDRCHHLKIQSHRFHLDMIKNVIKLQHSFNQIVQNVCCVYHENLHNSILQYAKYSLSTTSIIFNSITYTQHTPSRISTQKSLSLLSRDNNTENFSNLKIMNSPQIFSCTH